MFWTFCLCMYGYVVSFYILLFFIQKNGRSPSVFLIFFFLFVVFFLFDFFAELKHENFDFVAILD